MAIAQGGSTKLSPAIRSADDARAQASIGQALKVLAYNYQVFGNYSIDGVVTLRILDHRLRSVSTLAARGQGKTFFVSVRSAAARCSR